MIEDSINWIKGTELAKEIIPMKNIEKIKISEKHVRLSEYKSLIDFLFSKLNYSKRVN